MYFGDGQLDIIEMAYLNGSGRMVVLNESKANTHYFGLALDAEYIYFTDWSDTSSSKYWYLVTTAKAKAKFITKLSVL